jgi:hypothetical protein
MGFDARACQESELRDFVREVYRLGVDGLDRESYRTFDSARRALRRPWRLEGQPTPELPSVEHWAAELAKLRVAEQRELNNVPVKRLGADRFEVGKYRWDYAWTTTPAWPLTEAPPDDVEELDTAGTLARICSGYYPTIGTGADLRAIRAMFKRGIERAVSEALDAIRSIYERDYGPAAIGPAERQRVQRVLDFMAPHFVKTPSPEEDAA